MQHPMARREVHGKVSAECVKKRNILRDPGDDDRIILKRILKKYGARIWMGFIWLKIRSVIGSGAQDYGPSRSIS